ncbi:MAG: NAD-dependent deacylase [Myxococcales bacterium]|nr:NAD-dependent deacylase [Myxococcales bacterium]
MTSPLGIQRYRHIVVLTGAGISVASGLRPYRGPGGLWLEAGVAALATPQALAERPADVWRLFGPLRALAKGAQPNAGHAALAAAEARLTDAEFTIITQNIDGLHQRAGSRNVIELHGSAFRTRCSDAACELKPFDDHDAHAESVPPCPRCSSVLRPDVVLFDEALPGGAEWHAKRALRDCDLFLAVGTSGTVSPASNFVRAAEFALARTVLVNLEPMKPRHPAFDEEYLGRAEELLPVLLA